MVQRFIEFYSWETPLVNPFNWKHEKLKSRDRKLLEFAPLIGNRLKIASWLLVPTFQLLKSILCHSLYDCMTLSSLCLSFLYG